jgi:hypothetical protein
VVVDGNGKIIETWKQWDKLFRRPHSIYISPYDPEKNVWIGQGVSAFQPAADGIHFGAGARDGDAVRHAAEGKPQTTGLPLLEVGSRHQWRCPQCGRPRPSRRPGE